MKNNRFNVNIGFKPKFSGGGGVIAEFLWNAARRRGAEGAEGVTWERAYINPNDSLDVSQYQVVIAYIEQNTNSVNQSALIFPQAGICVYFDTHAGTPGISDSIYFDKDSKTLSYADEAYYGMIVYAMR